MNNIINEISSMIDYAEEMYRKEVCWSVMTGDNFNKGMWYGYEKALNDVLGLLKEEYVEPCYWGA